jgi:hypothetical protein
MKGKAMAIPWEELAVSETKVNVCSLCFLNLLEDFSGRQSLPVARS